MKYVDARNSSCIFQEMNPTYSKSAPKTNRMHAIIQASIAVRHSALGVLVATLLKMLMSARSIITNKVILAGIFFMGIKKEIQETITQRPGKKKSK